MSKNLLYSSISQSLLLAYLLMEHLQVSDVARGVVITVLVIMWLGSLYSILTSKYITLEDLISLD